MKTCEEAIELLEDLIQAVMTVTLEMQHGQTSRYRHALNNVRQLECECKNLIRELYNEIQSWRTVDMEKSVNERGEI